MVSPIKAERGEIEGEGEGERNCLKYLKGGWSRNREERRRNKYLKKGGATGRLESPHEL